MSKKYCILAHSVSAFFEWKSQGSVRKVIFAHDEHKFAVHGHVFADGEHKFAAHEHKIVKCVTNIVVPQKKIWKQGEAK